MVPEPFLPPLVADLPPGVLQVRLPTPFSVGAVNCYVLVDPPMTVIDPGTVMPASLELLVDAMAVAGRSLADVEQVVVTHAHPDHSGAAAWLARHSGADILAGRAEVDALQGRRNGGRRAAMLAALGLPAPLVDAALTAPAHGLDDVVEWADAATIVPIDDGDIVRAGGRDFTAHVTAGHAAGHLSLWCDDGRILLSGDHLLARIVPLPDLEPSDAGGGHRRSLEEYLASLPRFVDLDPEVVLPGHGQAFTGVDVLARRLRSHHADRCAEVGAIVRQLGHPTPFDIARQLLWQAEGGRLLRGVAEVVGHLDVLEHDGAVVAEPAGPVHRYRASST